MSVRPAADGPAPWRVAATGQARLSLLLVVGFIATHAVAYLVRSPALLGVAIVWLIPLPILLARCAGRAFDPLEPIWIFSALFVFAYGVVPGAELLRPQEFQSLPGFMTLAPPDYYVAAWLGGAAFIVFCLAYFWAPVSAIRLNGRWTQDRGGLTGLTVTGCGLVAVGLLALEVNLQLAHASALSLREILTGQLRTALIQTEEGKGYLNLGYMALSTGLICLGLAVGEWAARAGARHRWVSSYFVAAAGVSVLLFGLVLGSRSLAIVTIVGLIAAYHYRVKRIPSWFVLPALLVLALGAVIFISLRNGHRVTVDPVSMAAYASKTFDGFNFLVTALARVHHLLWGRSMGQDLLYTYFPRALFPDKPLVYGIVLAQDTVIPGLSNTVGSGTYPPGMLAEGYVNFGLAGLFALPAFAALLLRLSYDSVRLTFSAVPVVIFAYLLGNPVGMLRGFGPVIPSLVVLFALLLGLQIPSRLLGRGRLAVGLVAAALVLGSLGVAREAHPQIASPADVGSANTPKVPSPVHVGARGAAIGVSGKPTMVIFTSSWCTACGEVLREASTAAQGMKLPAYVVDVQDAGNEVASTIRRAGFRLPVIADDGDLMLGAFHADALPSVLFVRKNVVLCRIDGPSGATAIEQAAVRILAAGRC